MEYNYTFEEIKQILEKDSLIKCDYCGKIKREIIPFDIITDEEVKKRHICNDCFEDYAYFFNPHLEEYHIYRSIHQNIHQQVSQPSPYKYIIKNYSITTYGGRCQDCREKLSIIASKDEYYLAQCERCNQTFYIRKF